MLHSRLFSFPIDKFGKFLKMSAKSLPLNKKTRISEHSDNIELAEASELKRNYPRSMHPEIQEKISEVHASRNPSDLTNTVEEARQISSQRQVLILQRPAFRTCGPGGNWAE